MKHGKLLIWLSAAVIGVGFGAASYSFTAETGITAAAETGEDTTDSGLSYTYDTVSKEATITGYSGSSRDVTIPSKIGIYTVTKIGASAFYDQKITSVVIPDTVTEIGEDAFRRCINLTELTLPQVKTVGKTSFMHCFSLVSVSMPQVRTIGESAFYYCPKMTSVSAPLAETIGDAAFCYSTALTYISLPKARTLGGHAFAQCSVLRSISIPKVETISDYAFNNCSALSSIHPKSVKTIGYCAFSGCKGLTDISLPDSVTEIGMSAFSHCTGLTSVQIWGPAKLCANAFYNCTSLISVTLSKESYTDPSTVAFYHCPNLQRIHGIPVYTYETDAQGHSYPVVSSDPEVRTVIQRHFGNSLDVGFVNDYCTALCNYVVETETDPWMDDMLKARQLHDWLVRHMEYSNGSSGMPGSWPGGVFFSYAFNARGEGIGEAVCSGYAEAYSMLLAAADIESYRIHGSGHEWNVVKIDGEYYQVDTTWDDPVYLFTPEGFVKHADPYSTEYTYFMKSYAEMVKVSSHSVQELDTYDSGHHPLLAKYTCSDPDIAKLCTKSLRDVNKDGIADFDFDMDGKGMQDDFQDDLNAYNYVLSFLYPDAPANTNANDYVSSKLPEIFYNLHQLHWSFTDFVNNCGPHDQTVETGDTATFSVTLFGSGLSYQWQYQNAGSSAWTNSTADGAKTASVSTQATDSKNGRKYRCVVTNQKGDTRTFGPAVLYVNPKITKQPANVTASIDSPVSFTVKANGSGLTYQWQYMKSGASEWKNSTASGAKTATVSTTATEARNFMLYRCIITNQNGKSVTSDTAVLFTAPKITAQPKKATKAVGSTAKFTVTAEGTGLTYQWQYRKPNSDTWQKSTATGAQTATVSVSATEARNGYQYRCVITNKSGISVTSSPAALAVTAKITAQPQKVTKAVGSTAKFTVTAEGTGLTYQWQYQSPGATSWTNLSSATSASLSVTATEARNGYQYRCVIKNSLGNSVTSSGAKLTVTAKITAQPQKVTKAVGSTAKFTVTAEGTGLTYQWQYQSPGATSWTNLSSATSASLSVTATEARDGYLYRCVIKNSLGNSVTTSGAKLTVTAKITSQPKGVTKAAGSIAKFTVAAEGTGLSYQWQYQSPGATSWTNLTSSSANKATLSVTATTARNGYQYRCVITNSLTHTVTSAAATLTVE